ncbi:hypothetical protein CcaverHIS002_0203590 [Cutaneotrichosporon cavernicola]|uniref:Uncharacterized protein n=1 Tax=Cutaneotrichosporon cavernicola TaxID=279322 RepID=A0AA48I3L1_9TREE|nr:uncharacterized protein CcaverHIS019_0203560 [Cutaneotrichosporon cavernicola]BEI81199.1 hypothetical protein CcaverHIS002_0203590 [Cutaneotrichosporon cavernicola]BEI88994.1 hypothetical protein CcaverHIS019_0203560 [Cutaneotrichosporon cavernicola]BEI96770.1 hypothetical protein CcaverHIS631_0203590 [Cutaneotrichosporon cavernicola]BEJ04542.1 hypothetical protein CcaverHIS641_0203590 [Cutaneotrichosporon cavernicola]
MASPATPPCSGECLDRAFDNARQTLEDDSYIFDYIKEGGSLSPDEAAMLRARVKVFRPRLEYARAAVLRHSQLIDQWIKVNERFASLVDLEEEVVGSKDEELEASKVEGQTDQGSGGEEGGEVTAQVTGEVTTQAMEVDGAVPPEATTEVVEE